MLWLWAGPPRDETGLVALYRLGAGTGGDDADGLNALVAAPNCFRKYLHRCWLHPIGKWPDFVKLMGRVQANRWSPGGRERRNGES